MSDINWIRLSTGLFDNRKIKFIEHMPDGDSIIVIWCKLLCLGGQINDDGFVYLTKEIPFTEDIMASLFERPIATVRLALDTFQRFGMIEILDDVLHISNWERYQNIDGMNRIREQTRKRVAEHRERKRLEGNATVTQPCNVTVTECNATDKNRIDKNRLDKNNSKFVPPTVEEIQEYIKEIGSSVDAQRFFDYYAKQGWLLANGNKMKDWKAAIRNWNRDEKKPKTESKNSWMKGYVKK